MIGGHRCRWLALLHDIEARFATFPAIGAFNQKL
jgi:hypothetical protein